MDIMYAGHLDRCFLMGSKSNRFRMAPSGDQAARVDAFDPYRSFFHRAGMMYLLSAGVVRPSDRPLPTEEIVSHRGRDGRMYDSIRRAELEDDTTRLPYLVVKAKAFSETTIETMRLRAPEDPHEPDLVHHVEGILFMILQALQCRATLVLADCDRQVLVELLECVIGNGIALPFCIPDLRKMKTFDGRNSGPVANLRPGDHGDLGALREDPAMRAYRQRLSRLSENRMVNVGTLLKAALAEARKSCTRIREASADIMLTSTWVRTIDTVDLDLVRIDPFRWTDRKPLKPKMHIVVLGSPRSPA